MIIKANSQCDLPATMFSLAAWIVLVSIPSSSLSHAQSSMPAPETDSDPLAAMCNVMCRDENRDMMTCARENKCDHNLRELNFNAYRKCLDQCQESSSRCFSLCEDNHSHMVISCTVQCGDSLNCMLPCLLDIFSQINTPTPLAPNTSSPKKKLQSEITFSLAWTSLLTATPPAASTTGSGSSSSGNSEISSGSSSSRSRSSSINYHMKEKPPKLVAHNSMSV
ncbi:hypothetical protein PoB_003223200 [Plakobranchus ocellatus]|uniref:Uncharacterized protein n=1 Tax=Plakobranchus ocellatus TaxID=259542 RepID=A0AAV4AFQ8_9GAST|nr:hypothetical protein PoB_003223200 [Plakobranchus ocellatus]